MSLGRLGDAAQAIAASGKPVFPCQPRGKVPAVAGGFHAATTKPAQICAWWEAEPELNIGLPIWLGGMVLDVDRHHGGEDSLARMEAEHGALPKTSTATTPSGGQHFFLRVPEGVEVRQTAGELGPGLDTRAPGRGYVVCAPSIGANGQPYRWRDRSPIAEAPHWLVALIRVPAPAPAPKYVPPIAPAAMGRRARYAAAVLAGEARAVAETGEGGRNHRLNKAWFRCAAFRDVLDRSAVERELTAAAIAAGLPASEIEQVLR